MTESITKATTFKQWTLKLEELGKAALIAGITTAVTAVSASIYNQHIPTVAELKAAAITGLFAAASVMIRDFAKPTVTVIKGQVEPVVSGNTKSVTITDVK